MPARRAIPTFDMQIRCRWLASGPTFDLWTRGRTIAITERAAARILDALDRQQEGGTHGR
jgi:hypothetical protein